MKLLSIVESWPLMENKFRVIVLTFVKVLEKDISQSQIQNIVNQYDR